MAHVPRLQLRAYPHRSPDRTKHSRPGRDPRRFGGPPRHLPSQLLHSNGSCRVFSRYWPHPSTDHRPPLGRPVRHAAPTAALRIATNHLPGPVTLAIGSRTGFAAQALMPLSGSTYGLLGLTTRARRTWAAPRHEDRFPDCSPSPIVEAALGCVLSFGTTAPCASRPNGI